MPSLVPRDLCHGRSSSRWPPALDSVLKSRDVTLLRKVHIVKAMVFLVDMYGCESWTIKKAELEELMPLNSAVGEDS